MEVYFGGAFQGKLDYVLKKKGNLKVADGRDCDEKRLQSADVVNHHSKADSGGRIDRYAY